MKGSMAKIKASIRAKKGKSTRADKIVKYFKK